MKKSCIGIACMILGIIIMAVPFAKEWYEDTQQEHILNEWKKEVSYLDTGGDKQQEKSPQTEEISLELQEQVVGILKIPAINLEQPILYGATEENLNLSVASIEPTGRPGKEGNMAIAGHNSRTYGRHFNRLSELKEEDGIIVQTVERDYSYHVTDIFVADAEEVWVLEDTTKGDEITLITCYYPQEGETQRLIVKGMADGK